MSLLFFGLLLAPLLAILIYLIRQDKHKAKAGLILLCIGIIVAAYVIIKYDRSFTAQNPAYQQTPAR